MLTSVFVAPVARSYWGSVRAILGRIPGLAMTSREVVSSVSIVKGIPATRTGIVSCVTPAHPGVDSAVDAIILARVSCRRDIGRMAREVVGWEWHRSDCNALALDQWCLTQRRY